MEVGAIEILPVLDGVGKERAAEVLTRPGVPDAWACHADSLDEHGTLHLDLGGFLVRTDDRVVLVDAGVGTINTDRYAGGGFLASLDRLGVTAEMVTDVVFTHLHFDHVGWATKRGEVVFPRATVFDVDPVAARAARNVIADEVADSGDVVVGAHFPQLRFGRVVTVAGNRTFRQIAEERR